MKQWIKYAKHLYKIIYLYKLVKKCTQLDSLWTEFSMAAGPATISRRQTEAGWS